jgi:hypothetical protein
VANLQGLPFLKMSIQRAIEMLEEMPINFGGETRMMVLGERIEYIGPVSATLAVLDLLVRQGCAKYVQPAQL